MEFRKVKFESIRGEWEQLYNDNKAISPYMDYEFQKIIKKYLRIGAKRMFARYVCYAGYVEGQVRIILPLICKKNEYYIAGDLCATGYWDFIYSDTLPLNMLREAVLFATSLGKFHFNKINQHSKLKEVLSSLCDSSQKGICVNISLPESFETYFSSLSKHARQNYRTANNRLKREEKPYRVDFVQGNCVKEKDFLEMLDVYNKREAERNGKPVGSIERFVRKHFNPITIASKELENSFWSILYIENKVAAFLCGFYNNNGEVAVIPRLAINTEYSLYCPGEVLVVDTIRYLFDNSRIKHFDLSRGEEKYKYVLGGKEHYNYNFLLQGDK